MVGCGDWQVKGLFSGFPLFGCLLLQVSRRAARSLGFSRQLNHALPGGFLLLRTKQVYSFTYRQYQPQN